MTETTTDVVVIGAGIAGVGVSAYLSEETDVVLLDWESQPGYHSTGRSAALFIPTYGSEVCKLLTNLSAGFFKQSEFDEIVQKVLSPRGYACVSRPHDEEAFDALISESSELEEISLESASEMVPILDIGKFSRAYYEEGVYDIDVELLLRGMLRHATNNGVKLHLNSKVTAISRDGSEWIVRAGQISVRSRIVVNAAGAWADEIATLAGLPPVGIIPKRRTAAIISFASNHDVSNWPLFAEVAGNWYATPQAGKLMVSPADEDPVPACDAYADDMVLLEGLDRFEKAVSIEVSRVDHSWAGLRNFSPDGDPVIGFDSLENSFFWLAGQGGTGVQSSPASSRLAADLIFDQAAVNAKLKEAVSPERYR